MRVVLYGCAEGFFVCFGFHIHKKERSFCGNLVLYECENLITFGRELVQIDVIPQKPWTNTIAPSQLSVEQHSHAIFTFDISYIL